MIINAVVHKVNELLDKRFEAFAPSLDLDTVFIASHDPSNGRVLMSCRQEAVKHL